MEENILKCTTKGNSSPNGKPRIYFTCHPDDFSKYFDKICDDIFKTHDPAIYYTPDMTAKFDEESKETDLGRSNLFVIPVTYNLLTEKSRTMEHDFPYAIENHIPILPIMMEHHLEMLYYDCNKFSELQYLNSLSTDQTEISYNDKLKKFLNTVLIGDELAKKVRSAFSAHIFLSYRKKDRIYANELMKLIHRIPECRDIAIWFDEFLSPGESFTENIEKILRDSELFTLLVTPNLLDEPGGKPNFVMAKEYPLALSANKEILPAEMEYTNKSELTKKFRNLPTCINPKTETEALKSRLTEALNLIDHTNNNSPEHNFLIGLAYLEGIDVEVNKSLGISMITKAAEENLPEAMQKLRDMYGEGIGVNFNGDKALSWAEKLYEYCEKEYGNEHSETLIALENFASLCKKFKTHTKALDFYKKIYSLKNRIFGTKHPETLTALENYALSCTEAGDNSTATALFLELVELYTDTIEENPVNAIRAYNEFLDAAYKACGSYDMTNYFERTYEFCRNRLGEEHPETLRALNNLSYIYRKNSQNKKADKLAQRAYNLCIKTLGEHHTETINSLYNLASMQRTKGKPGKALELYEKVYLVRCESLGGLHPHTLDALRWLAYCYGDKKISQKKKSMDLYLKAYYLYLRVFGKNHPETMEVLSELIDSTLKINRFKKALEYLEILYPQQVQLYGEDDERTIKSYRKMVCTKGRIKNLAKKNKKQ